VKKIAFIVVGSGAQLPNHGGLSRKGRLQIVDLILKAADFFGYKQGEKFYQKVAYFCDSRPSERESVDLAIGLSGEFADLVKLALLPHGWGRSSGGGDKIQKLIEMLENSETEAAFVFGYLARRSGDPSGFEIDTILKHWGINARSLPTGGADACMCLVDTVAKTVDYVKCIYSQR
jgi:hypothetical protein